MDFTLFVRWIPEKPTPFFLVDAVFAKKNTPIKTQAILSVPVKSQTFSLLCKKRKIRGKMKICVKVQLKFFVEKK